MIKVIDKASSNGQKKKSLIELPFGAFAMEMH